MKVALYARISDEKQAEKDLSIPAQLKALRKYSIERGWEVAAEYFDEAFGAIGKKNEEPAPYRRALRKRYVK
jgi:DNA invertase Pin-like site-specific DNA recombinase